MKNITASCIEAWMEWTWDTFMASWSEKLLQMNKGTSMSLKGTRKGRSCSLIKKYMENIYNLAAEKQACHSWVGASAPRVLLGMPLRAMSRIGTAATQYSVCYKEMPCKHWALCYCTAAHWMNVGLRYGYNEWKNNRGRFLRRRL